MDEALIQGILKKDESSVLRFVHTYQDLVFGQAFRILGNRQDAEDASQEIFVKALRNIHTFERRSKLSTWLYQITYTTCLDVLKKKKRRPKEVELPKHENTSWATIQNTLHDLEQAEQRKIIDQAIAQLSPKDASLIDLFYLKEQSVKEIVEITGMSLSNVKVSLLRARKKLGIILEQHLSADTLNMYKDGNG